MGELATGVCSVNTSIPRQPAPTSHKLLPTNLSKEPDRQEEKYKKSIMSALNRFLNF